MLNLKSCMTAVAALLLLGQTLVARAELPDFTPLVEEAAPAPEAEAPAEPELIRKPKGEEEEAESEEK